MQRTILMFLGAATAAMLLSAQDSEEATKRRYDIRALKAAMTEKSWSFPFTALLPSPGGAGEASVRLNWGSQEETSPGPDVGEVVGFVLGCDCGVSSEGSLRVAGSQQIQGRVPAVLAELQRAVVHSIEVELSILPRESLETVSSAVLDAPKADRLLEIAKPIATLRTRLSPGSETLFESVARRAYVKDYDTEVAQGAKTFDPLVDVLPEGLRVSVRVDRTPDGAFIVAVRGQAAEQNGPARIQMLNLGTPGVLHLPQAWVASTAASARLEDRHSMLIGNDVTPRAVWLLRVIGDRETPPTDKASLRMVPLGAATREPLRTYCSSWFSPNASGACGGSNVGIPEDQSGDSRVIWETAREEIDAISLEGVASDQRKAMRSGNLLVLQGDPRFVTEAGKLVEKMIDDATRTYTIEVRTGTVPAAGFALPAPDELSTLVDRLTQRASTAAIAGDRVVIIAGESHAYLKDRDIEIAEAISVDDPIVDVFFTGLSMAFQVLPLGDDRCSIETRFEYQELLELMPVATGSVEVPELELPRIASVHGIVPVTTTLGSWALVHTAPIEGTDRQLVILIRVSKA